MVSVRVCVRSGLRGCKVVQTIPIAGSLINRIEARAQVLQVILHRILLVELPNIAIDDDADV